MNNSDSAVTPVAATVTRRERVFPTLTSGQVVRMAAHGRRRTTTRGEVLVEVGDAAVPVFVVVTGQLQALRPTDRTETLIVNYHPGQFSGEANMISGRHALGRLRVSEAGEVIQLDREQLLALIQTDAEMTSRPGIFAVGDVRSGNVKRVAAAVSSQPLNSRLSRHGLRQSRGQYEGIVDTFV